jgi:N utilization substance protein B
MSPEPSGGPGHGGGRNPRSAQTARQRSSARLAAIQALYQMELAGTSADQVIREFVEQRLKEDVDGMNLVEADRRLFSELVRGVTAERGDLDDMLAAVLDEDWPVERLETLLLVLLRAGAYELSARTAVPVRVAISEYIALADAFFAGKEPGLVNGVLDRVGRALRPAEFEPESAGPAGRA